MKTNRATGVADSRIATLKAALHEWQSPEEMIGAAQELGDLLGDLGSMSRRGREFREAFIAGRMARRKSAIAVRLLKETGDGATPDFAIQIDGRELQYETTEADIPGRRRTDEYRKPATTEQMIGTDINVMVEHMRALAAKKALKSYEDCHGLVIWMNPPMFSFRPAARWEGLLRASEPAAQRFREVWIMRGAGALMWLNGQPQSEEPSVEF